MCCHEYRYRGDAPPAGGKHEQGRATEEEAAVHTAAHKGEAEDGRGEEDMADEGAAGSDEGEGERRMGMHQRGASCALVCCTEPSELVSVQAMHVRPARLMAPSETITV